MKNLWLALCLPLGLASAQAQSVSSWPPPAGTIAFLCVYNSVAPTMVTGLPGYVQCDINGQVKTTGGGGGGGGLSVTDQATWSQGVSSFTPSGGEFNDTSTVSTGTQGTFRMTTKRAQIVDVDQTGNALYSALTAPIPTQANTVSIGAVGQSGAWTNTVTQGTASNLNATVVGTGTFAVQAAATLAAETTKVVGTVRNADGNGVLYVSDPCSTAAKTTLPITLATAAVKVIAVGVSAKKIYVCHLQLTNNAADSIALFEATTGTTCVTSPVAVVGGGTSVATAATGYNFSANGGINTGVGSNQIHVTTVNNNDLCIAQSAATQLTGSITYVTQ